MIIQQKSNKRLRYGIPLAGGFRHGPQQTRARVVRVDQGMRPMRFKRSDVERRGNGDARNSFVNRWETDRSPPPARQRVSATGTETNQRRYPVCFSVDLRRINAPQFDGISEPNRGPAWHTVRTIGKPEWYCALSRYGHYRVWDLMGLSCDRRSNASRFSLSDRQRKLNRR